MRISRTGSTVAKTWIFAIGDVFATPFEAGCVVTTLPDDASGIFYALDSDGVECSYSVAMVTEIERTF